MRHALCILLATITLAGCALPGDNDRPAPPAPVSEVFACNTGGAAPECTISGAPVPCGANEVEALTDDVGVCITTDAPACAEIACEWMVECDLGGCTCVVGYPSGRLTTCTR